ncbi:hypothetical protein A3G67_04500 [Candidatus Roizmanbacteria bacterium RIFCSPLOWO2_12_FULL_40_12]|uniref:Glycosyltransferase 2-like domain-containing protein n=1 Tax=Candidatus Roizmanbacteria bacterium RIFCSPLOWO2_01_FULL_40_42 TaxID=1802066 RepID=A0A1F7J4S1_9BACT|nr:MAG: hypothetical protein A2779_04650 [Candidatus Roizmanbacteria bacterium RIFCSPHIGHO2_01_FULL_40_98]OGK27364.1 MAG: hypothetical protein A3C31_04975 [Candidatus Roizmanbacteria bacterium RIFCSPHIGHO2_02_FULL_40_53]OGK30764.1 MAG: hypothetical protein A2W49_02065 [Candidatus Roizmanbacteria bacterium RIFCSPHIGHO2_12_41_18]OGK36469.1 MAG: hypothetical protein A3E69_02600 [Candidatus Roizmanbacteria bacterium RIFCSPHIGHO2_12_FULL_40_130]OGK50597.1 MAG: hypothetical protein A3B50_02330 [Candi
MKSPDLSIVIVSFNTREVTKNCLESIFKSLEKTALSYEIVVVDNDSKDGSLEMLQKFQLSHPSIFQLIQNKTNIGFGKANNQGVKQTKAPYILLLNSDTVALEDAIEKLFEFYKNDNKVDFVGGKLLNKDMTPQPSCGPFYTLPIVFGALFLRGDHWNLTRYSPNATKEVDWVSGACIMAKKEYFQKLGGFDEEIFMYMEEIDLLYRAKKQGYKVFFYPQAQFIHLGSASSRGRTYPILQVYGGFLYLYRTHRSKLELNLLKFMLQLKAVISVAMGRATRNKYLIETYEKALKLTQED